MKNHQKPFPTDIYVLNQKSDRIKCPKRRIEQSDPEEGVMQSLPYKSLDSCGCIVIYNSTKELWIGGQLWNMGMLGFLLENKMNSGKLLRWNSMVLQGRIYTELSAYT